ncbi:hypothetical protein B0H14DRAFT_2761354 [Mycena olivaceomarginata]|nr:hypothetical protein B0H14DRAFT_2761354 [Mycena olivaceomarginata]
MRVQVAALIPLPVRGHFAIARVVRLCESAASWCSSCQDCVSGLSGGRMSASVSCVASRAIRYRACHGHCAMCTAFL